MTTTAQLTNWRRLVWVGSFVLLGLLAGIAAPVFFKVAENLSSSLAPPELVSADNYPLRAIVWSFFGLGLPFCIATLLGGYSILRISGIGTTLSLRKVAASVCALIFAYPAGLFLCLGFSSATLAIETALGKATDFYAWQTTPLERQLEDTIGFMFLLFAITIVILFCAQGVAVATGHLPRYALSVAIGFSSLFLLLVPAAAVIRDALHPVNYTVALSRPESYGRFELAIWNLHPYVWWVTNAVLAGLVGHWFLAGLQSQGERAMRQD